MELLLTFQNTHYAVHSEKVLIKNKISVAVMPLPTSLGDFCGICLRVAATDFVKGQNDLNEAKIPIEGIFRIEKNGQKRKYTPWSP